MAQEDLSATTRFVSLLTAHQGDLWAFILTLMPGHPDAKDVLQKTNVVIWEKHGSFEEGTDFRAWALTCARFTVLDHLRRLKGKSTVLLDDELMDTLASEAPERLGSSDRRLEALEYCLGKLRPQDRELVEFRYSFDGKGNSFQSSFMKVKPTITSILAAVALTTFSAKAGGPGEPLTYRHFNVEEADDRVLSMTPVPADPAPRWARDVSQESFDWTAKPDEKPFFASPVPFVLAPVDEGEPFGKHNHQPSITWLPNGELLAIWYSTGREQGTELTVLASRFRSGADAWDASSEFFKAPNRNMHGSSIFHDGQGTIYHFNGMAPDGGQGWAKLALLMRASQDNGATWTPPQAVDARLIGRHQVISGTLLTSGGALIQNCDAASGGNGGTALHISRDGGKTWSDPGEGKPKPKFTEGGKGEGTIAGIHAKVVELKDRRLLAFGRGDTINGRMPMSLSADLGKTWAYKATPFPPIGGGQRLVLNRLQEGALLLVSFTSGNRAKPEANGMTFTDQKGNEFTGYGMFASVSFDEGETWPVRKLLTPGSGDWNGGAWTQEFTATPTRAEHAGYLAATQTPDGVIHLISSRLHYRFNLPWLREGVSDGDAKPSAKTQS